MLLFFNTLSAYMTFANSAFRPSTCSTRDHTAKSVSLFLLLKRPRVHNDRATTSLGQDQMVPERAEF